MGGIASQGWKPAWALLRNRLNGQQSLRLEDAALCLLAQRWLDLIAALDTRGHANAMPQVVGQDGGSKAAAMPAETAQSLLALLHEASALAGDDEAPEVPHALLDALSDGLLRGLRR